jgi:hypothetical protein
MSDRTPKRGEIPLGRTIEEALTHGWLRHIELGRLEDSARIRRLERQAAPKPARKGDPRKPLLRKLKERFGATGRRLALLMDQHKVRPLYSWTKATKLRSWLELWDCKHPKVRAAVRKYVYVATGDGGINNPSRGGKPHKHR